MKHLSNSDKTGLWNRIAGAFNGAGGVLIALTLDHTLNWPLWWSIVIALTPSIISLFRLIIECIKEASIRRSSV